MKRLTASLVAAAALLGSTLAGTALAEDSNVQGALGASRAFNAQQGWNDRSDQDRYGRDSDWDRNEPNWGSDRGRFDNTILKGRWVADHRAADFRSDRGVFRGNGPMREILLPDFIRIDQKPSMVRIADSRNHALQQIMLGGKFNSRQRGKADYLLGRWRGSTLVVEHSMSRGATITQTFALENRGRTLVVKTRREGFGPRTMEVTSTYRRA
jgi:hypothetical protein